MRSSRSVGGARPAKALWASAYLWRCTSTTAHSIRIRGSLAVNLGGVRQQGFGFFRLALSFVNLAECRQSDCIVGFNLQNAVQLFLCSFVLPDAGIRLCEQGTRGGILRLGLKIVRENSYRFVGVSVLERGLRFSECF